jgi:hypothetical protein
VAGSCEFGDKPSDCGATDLVNAHFCLNSSSHEALNIISSICIGPG